MKKLVLSNEELCEEVLISYKGFNFIIKTVQGGQYGFERRASIFLIKKSLVSTHFKTIGILRLFSSDDVMKQSESEQCLIVGISHFEECLNEGIEYIEKYVDFCSK